MDRSPPANWSGFSEALLLAVASFGPRQTRSAAVHSRLRRQCWPSPPKLHGHFRRAGQHIGWLVSASGIRLEYNRQPTLRQFPWRMVSVLCGKGDKSGEHKATKNQHSIHEGTRSVVIWYDPEGTDPPTALPSPCAGMYSYRRCSGQRVLSIPSRGTRCAARTFPRAFARSTSQRET